MIIEETNTMKMTSEPQSISLIEPIVIEVFERYEISKDICGNVLVALTEAMNNAIQHGNAFDSSKSVCLSYNMCNSMLYFTVCDEGQGFNPEVIPDPTDPQNIDKPNGRGVFLMRRLADEVEFEKNGAMVRLGFRIQPN